MATTAEASGKRVPAEWEPQEAIWLQWPGPYEQSYRRSFAKMAAIIVRYQPLRILYNSNAVREQARKAILSAGGNPDHANLSWYEVPYDSAWMRDNGPVYVVDGGQMRIQNWQFNAWGGAFGADIPFAKDNKVPEFIGAILDMPVDEIDIVHERGNLEFNGVDSVILNWSTLGDPARNPGYMRSQAEDDLKRHFGVTRVVFIEGVTEGDRTRGRIDGIARFIDANTVVVPQCTMNSRCRPGDGRDSQVFDAAAAATIADAGFEVIREPIEGVATFRGSTFDTDYMNWIVGNGFVIAVGFDNPLTNAAAKQRIESYYPGRDVYVVEMLESWHAGGGAHCHTNDQPALSTILSTGIN